MKETKVYVDELPKSCYICPCYDTSEGFCSITGSYTKYKKGRILQDCPLIEIKDHDRELVKEVCEKIKLEFDKLEQNIINQPNIISDEYAQELIQKSYYNNAHRIVERVKQEYGK